MLLKDTFNLIKLTLKRFLTIVAIVLIGVAFMMGLTSTYSIMQKSVSAYNEKNNLHDIQVYSNYGFCEEDINGFKSLEYIKNVYPSKQIDSYCKSNSGEILISRTRELNSIVNKFELSEGRLPEHYDEVVVIQSRNKNINIGDVIEIYFGDEEDPITDKIERNVFKVVGIIESSEYMSKFLSASNYKNLDLDLIVFADNSLFKSEYYSCVYLTVDGARDYDSTTDEYEKYIDGILDQFDNFKNSQESYNKDKIIAEAKDEIKDGEKELEEKRADGQKELDDAKKELIDAWNEILDGQKKIDDGIIELEDGQEKVDDGFVELEKNEKKIKAAKAQVVEQGGGKSFEEIYSLTKTGVESYNSLISAKNELETPYQTVMSSFPGGVTEIEYIIGTLNPETDAEQIEYLNQCIGVINKYNFVLSTLETNFPENLGPTLIVTLKQLDQIIDGEKQIASGRKELNDAQYEIDKGWIEIEDAKNELADGKRKYFDGKKEYEDGVKEFNEKITDAEKELQEAREDLAGLEDAEWTVLDRQSHYTSFMFKNTVGQMKAIGIVMPILFFLVAALVCMTTMTRLVDEQRSQNGIYSALGYSKSYIIKKYLLYVFIASILGELPGIFIGLGIFPTVIYRTWRLLYNLPDIVLYIPALQLVISMCSFAVLMMLVTYIVLKKSLNEKPAQLMRPKAPKSSKAILLEKIKFIWNRLSFTSKITARNLIRYKARFFMTVIGVAGCTGLLVLGWGIKDSISDIVNVQYGNIFDYNYTINLDNDLKINNIVNDLNNINSVNKVVPYMSYISKVNLENGKSPTINTFVMDDVDFDFLFKLTDYRTDMKLTLEDDGVIITEKYAKNNNIKVGDTIEIESRKGKIAKVEVDAIATMYFQHYMFMSQDLYSHIFYEGIENNNIAINDPRHSDELFELKTNYSNINSIEDFSEFTSQFNIMIEALDLIIAVIILTAGALCFVVLINLIQVNISERIREIATFKVLGFRNNEINTYIFKEIIILTLIGSVVGLPLGKIELKFVMNVIDMEMVMFPTNIKPMSYVLGFAITAIFTIIVLISFIKPLKKVNMIESLKSVE